MDSHIHSRILKNIWIKRKYHCRNNGLSLKIVEKLNNKIISAFMHTPKDKDKQKAATDEFIQFCVLTALPKDKAKKLFTICPA